MLRTYSIMITSFLMLMPIFKLCLYDLLVQICLSFYFSVQCFTIKDVSDFPFVAHSTMFSSLLILVPEF